jgi:hypothetical protein
MGVDAGDIDADGDPDLVVTNFSHDHTTLYENLGTGFFTDASYRRGIGAPTYFPLSWGVQLLDLDSDGDSDLYVAHGHIYPDVERVAPETRYKEPDQVFRNDGNGRFELVEWSAPLGSSRGAAAGDYDGDGRIDLLVTNIDGPPHLLHNETVDGGRALVVELAGLRSSREGLGATVTVQMSARRLSQEAGTSGSHASARDPKLHFGVGRERVLSLEVVWPSGRRDRIEAPESSSIRALPPQPQRFSLPDSLRAPSARAEGSILVIKEGVGLVAARLFERAEAR